MSSTPAPCTRQSPAAPIDIGWKTSPLRKRSAFLLPSPCRRRRVKSEFRSFMSAPPWFLPSRSLAGRGRARSFGLSGDRLANHAERGGGERVARGARSARDRGEHPIAGFARVTENALRPHAKRIAALFE